MIAWTKFGAYSVERSRFGHYPGKMRYENDAIAGRKRGVGGNGPEGARRGGRRGGKTGRATPSGRGGGGEKKSRKDPGKVAIKGF